MGFKAVRPKKTVTINDDQFYEGVRAATLHFAANIYVGGNMFDELDRVQKALKDKLEPEFCKGVCCTRFQALAEDAAEKMYQEMPDGKRRGSKYTRCEREFIASVGKASRKGLGLKKTISKDNAKKAV